MANYHSPNHPSSGSRLSPYGPARSSTIPNSLSATTLSSPFQSSQQYYSTTGFTPMHSTNQRAESPMVTRAQYNVPYNPGQWMGGTRMPSDRELHDRAARTTEEGLNSPPPPYSPPPGSSMHASSAGSSAQTPLSISPAQTTPRNIDPISSQNYVPISSRDAGVSANQTGSAHMMQPARHFSPQNSGHNQYQDRSSVLAQTAATPLETSYSRGGPRASSMNIMTGGYGHDAGQEHHIPHAPVRPPLRSSSAGPSSAGPSRDSSMTREFSRSAWQPGMPLPGPPPGPPPIVPPSASRSQSASGVMDSSSRNKVTMIGNPRPLARVPALRAPALDTIPATPANWEDGMKSPTRPLTDLRIDTNVGGHRRVASATQEMTAVRTSDDTLPSSIIGANLARSSARRDSSVKGILERRAKRQSIHDLDGIKNNLTILTSPWAETPSAAHNNSASRQSSHDDLKIGSGRSTDDGNDGDLTPNTSAHETIKSGGVVDSQRTPKYYNVQASSSATPPETPAVASELHRSKHNGLARQTGKALPTPPLSQKTPVESAGKHRPRSDSVGREDHANEEYFMAECTRRHQDFLARERNAKSDIQKLQLFTEFVLSEAAIRRLRYADAFASGNFDVVAARAQLFEEPSERRKHRSSKSAASPPTRTTQPVAAKPDLDTEEADLEGRQDGVRFRDRDYQPMLSPIVSMDEYSSRGRPASRWWESDTGSPVDGPRRMKRSKRESKYMGLSAAVMQSTMEEQDAQNDEPEVFHSVSYPDEKANPETFGYYAEPSPALRSGRMLKAKNPATPKLLDVSRFITLPPPYPRHYPAVNNAHPDLSEYRNTVRSLGDLTEVRERKSRHQQNASALKNERQRRLTETRRAFRENIQLQIAEGSMTYADAAEAEQTLVQSEQQLERRDTQAEFESLQDVVIKPLHDILNDRVVGLTESIDQLRQRLTLDAENSDPDGPQQEGDETPELLEYLTQYKWLFETREAVHKELFDLVSDRNEQYKKIVLLPYRHARNTEKVRDTEEFFARDTQVRRRAFCNESLERHQTFFRTIEANVARGVQLQSSAFWDIAPGLVDLLQKIPENVRTMEPIAIPEQELEENPSYLEHPNQYLYTLLEHAEKSTYQFIESQTNLHCLLHEAKSSMYTAKRRAVGADRSRSHQSDMDFIEDTESQKAHEEATLTNELKQKVSVIEEQWLEGLGSELQATRERIKAALVEDGVWDQMNDAE